MYWKKNRLGAAMIALLGLAVASCSCEGETGQRLAPEFLLSGDGVGPDSTGAAHYQLDFHTVAVGNRAVPEVFITNNGNAKLTVDVEDYGAIPVPFALNVKSIELAPKEKKQLQFSVAPKEGGEFSAIITFKTNEASRVKKVRLVGAGVASEFSCVPNEVDLGDVVRGEGRSTSLTCSNPLTVPTTVALGPFSGVYQKFFKAEFEAGDGKQVEVPAGGSVGLRISFEAESTLSGEARTSLPINDPSGRPMLNLSVSANVVEHALQFRVEKDGERIPLEGCHPFPDVDINERVEQTVYIRNLSRNSINLEQLSLLPKDSAHFSLVSPSADTVIPVPPEGAEDVEVVLAFHPAVAGKHRADLVVESDDPLSPSGGVSACVSGTGGGARISCLPSSIDFGPVAFDMQITRTYSCINDSQIREGSPPQILWVQDVQSNNPVFDAVIRNVDGSFGPDDTKGYAPGEKFFVDVTYAPIRNADEALDSGIITIHSQAAGMEAHETIVTGRGRDLVPCEFTLGPASLRFGVVEPGFQRTLTAYVTNHLDTECVISNVRLGGDTHSAFSLAEEVEYAVIAPAGDEEGGDRFPITVTFAPADYGTVSGSVEFYISNPANPEHSIPLSGIAAQPCLEFDPEDLDFGAAPPKCSGRDQEITIRNVCSKPLTVTAIEIDETYEHFNLNMVPYLPMELKAGDSITFQTYFLPLANGDHVGAVTVEVTDSDTGADVGPYTLEMKGRGTADAIQTDTYTQSDNPKVDVLWVVDNSGSMSTAQSVIQVNVPTFMQFAVEQGIDFHIGVTTSGINAHPGSACTANTGFTDNEDGRLVPHPSVGRDRILKKSMNKEHLYETFRQNVDVGICHGWEAMYEAARLALSDPWINTPHEDAGNAGFLRKDASLSIIGVTDEDDIDSIWGGDPSADRSVEEYVKFFRSLKPKSKEESVKVHFISGGLTGCSSPWAMACPRCMRGPELTGGVHLDICTPSGDEEAWNAAFTEMSQGAFGFDHSFKLRGTPDDVSNPPDGVLDQEDIEVRVDGRVVSQVDAFGGNVWRYNADAQTIVFSSRHIPGPNQTIEVTYKVACVRYLDD